MKENRVGKLSYVKLNDGSFIYLFELFEKVEIMDSEGNKKLKLKLIEKNADENFETIFGCDEDDYPLVKKYIEEGLDLYCYFDDGEVVSSLKFLSLNLGNGYGKDVLKSVEDLERFINADEKVFAKNYANALVLAKIATNCNDMEA